LQRSAGATGSASERSTTHRSCCTAFVGGLVDSFFPSLAELDDRIDELEDAIFLKADENQLQEIFQMKRLLVGMRKTVTPQRDAFASLMGGVAELPGLAEEDEHYFRDVYDHLIRISDLSTATATSSRAQWTSISQPSRIESTR